MSRSSLSTRRPFCEGNAQEGRAVSLRVWTAHDSPSPPDIRSAKSEAAAVSTAVASRAGKKSDSASHGHEYEFGGPIGTTINTIALPFVILFLYTACPNGDGNFCLQGVDVFSLVNMPIPSAESLWSWQAMCLYLAWFGFLVFLERVLPYTQGEGIKLATGEKLSYRINGHLSFWVAIFIVEHGFGSSLVYLYDNYVQLAVASITFSSIMSVYLYARSFNKGALLAEGGRTGCPPYDFWMGRELNPRFVSIACRCGVAAAPACRPAPRHAIPARQEQAAFADHASLPPLPLPFRSPLRPRPGLPGWDRLT